MSSTLQCFAFFVSILQLLLQEFFSCRYDLVVCIISLQINIKMRKIVASDESHKFQAKSYMTGIGRSTCEGSKKVGVLSY